MIDSVLKMIDYEEPTKLLKNITFEIGNHIKEHIKKDILIFVYDSPQDILSLFSSTFDNQDEFSVFNIHVNKDFLNNLMVNEKIVYEINNEDEINFPIKYNSLFIYPVKYENALIGALGTSEMIPDSEIKTTIQPFSLIIQMVVENLRINEFKNKVELAEKLTTLFETVNSENELIKNSLIALKDTLHAEIVAFWKFDEERLFLYELYGIDNEKIINNFLDIDISIEGKVYKESNSILAIKNETHSFEDVQLPFDVKIKSALYSKLTIENEDLGVVALYNREQGVELRPYKHFDQLDQVFLNNAMRRLSLGLSKIFLYDRLNEEIDNLQQLRESHEELIKLQKEQLEKMNSLHKISQAIRTTYDKNNAVKIMLLGLTSGRGLKFNRALYLEKDKIRGLMIPKLWLGPDDDENVEILWKEANRRAIKYGDIIQYLREEALQLPLSNKLTEKVKHRHLAYKGNTLLERIVNKKQVIHVVPHMLKIKFDELEDIYDIIKTDEFLIFPVSGRYETKGIVVLDNKITHNVITNVDIEIIKLFQDSIGLGLEMIENYEELKEKTTSLENQKNMIDYYRRFNENILQNLGVAIIVVDRAGKILEWNQKAEELFLKERSSMIGTSIKMSYSLLNDDIINVLEEIYVTKEDMKLPNYAIQMNGEDKILNIQFSPLWNREIGVIEGSIIVIEDVTEVYNMQKEMEKRERLAVVGEMTARVAHEIRNPLTVIGGFLNRMNKKIDDIDSVKKYSGIIQDEVSRLENIVSEILEYSRGQKVSRFEDFNLNEIIEDTIDMFEDMINEKRVLLDVKLHSEVKIFGDRSRLKQVIINLVKNALEVIPADNSGRLEIITGFENTNAFFQIANNGEHIPKDRQEKLFLPFFTTKTHGTGLGLPICKKIIHEEHNGNLYLVKSDENSTIFRFDVPITNK